MIGTSYEINVGAVKGVGVKSIYRKLNEQGILLEEAKYNMRGETIKESIFLLDNDMNIKKIQIFENHKGIVQTVYIKKDDNSRLEEQLITNPDKTYEKRNFDYDLKGNIEDVDVYDSEFGFTRMIYGYNEKAQLTLITELNKYRDVYEKTNFKYDDKGNLIEISSYTGDGGFIFKHTYTYLPNNLIQWETNFDTNGEPIQITKFTYEFY